MSEMQLTEVAPRNRKLKTKSTKTKNPKLFIAVCTIPALLLTLVFMIIPTFRAFFMSFTDATGMSDENKFIFLDNYKYMFQDEMFLKALSNTFKLMLVVPVVTLAFGLVLAFLLTQTKLKERLLPDGILFPQHYLFDGSRDHMVLCVSSEHGDLEQYSLKYWAGSTDYDLAWG